MGLNRTRIEPDTIRVQRESVSTTPARPWAPPERGSAISKAMANFHALATWMFPLLNVPQEYLEKEKQS